MLRSGVVLIDTPGIGSTLRHNTEATLSFLPQCDAALFVLSADLPVTATELAFLESVRAQMPRLFFVLNKADYLSPEETLAATDFLRVTLAKAGISRARIFLVSARQGLEARRQGDDALWNRSGMAEIERDLLAFLATEKSAALHEAIARKAADALGDLLLQLGLVVRSLEMPVEELERKLATLAGKIAEAQGQRRLAKDLLTGDRLHLREFLEEHAGALRSQAVAHLEGHVEAAMAAGNAAGGGGERKVQEVLAGEIPVYFERQSREATALIRRRTAEVLGPHQRRADELTAAIRSTAAELFEVPHHAPDSSGAFETVRQPYWVTQQGPSILEPIPPGAWEAFLPAGIRRRWIEARWRGQLRDLVTRNVENLRWALFQNIDEAFLRFGSSLAENLAETVAVTHGAVAAAAAGKTHHEVAVREDIIRLRQAQAKLAELKAALASESGASSA